MMTTSTIVCGCVAGGCLLLAGIIKALKIRKQRQITRSLRPDDPKYRSLSSEVAEHFKRNDRERERLAEAHGEIEVIYRLVRELHHAISGVSVGETHVTAWVALPSYKKGLAPALRWLARQGWRIKSRAEDKTGQTQDIRFYSKEYARDLLLYFTSACCQRVKVGMRTEEVPVYETRCE